MGALARLPEVPGFVLTPRPKRFTAQQTVEELEELERTSVPGSLCIICLSIHPSIYLATYLCIYLSI